MNTAVIRERLLSSTVICSVAALLATGAQAQTSTAPSAPDAATTVGAQTAATTTAEDTDVIVVTGSRIARAAIAGTSPVTILNSQDVKLQGITRTEDLVNSLPQAFAGQGGNIANGATGTSNLNLRGLGSERTLVLINGRRLVPGDPTSSAADINFIPAAMIERVEVLTGGASSVYGSDALGGVANFVLNTDFEGFRVDGQYSLFNHNNNGRQIIRDAQKARGFSTPSGNVTDGGTIDVTAVFGASFGSDKRGHVTAYAGYRKINAVLQADRDYSACVAEARTPAQVAGGLAAIRCGGSATSANGTFFTNEAVEDGSRTSQTLQVGPNRTFVPGSTAFNFAPYNHYQRPDERYTAGAFANYEVSSGFKPYMEFMFMDDRTRAQIAPSGNFGNTLTVNCDNPLLSAQQLAIVCAPNNLAGLNFDDPTTTTIDESSPATTFVAADGTPYQRGNLQILRRNVEGGGRVDDLQHTTYRFVAGAKGDIGSNFGYDAYYQYGRVNFAETYLNDFSVSRLGRALDVVSGPGGTPICRSVQDGTDPNCVPYDIFALNGVTPAAASYLGVPGFQRGQTSEQVANATITGQLGDYGIKSPLANDGLGFAAGFEYRKESLNLDTDLEFQTGDLAGQGAATLPVRGSFNVKEFYVEARLPLIQDGFIKELSVEGGYRYSKYKNAVNSFSTDTYKFAVEFAPVSDIRFRASYNRAVRAPNVQDLFAPQRVVLNGSSDPCAGDFNPDTPAGEPEATQAQCLLTGVSASQYGNITANPAGQYNGLIGGDPTLDPEKGTTKSFGVVLTPTFLPGFSATVDYFDIKITNTIQQIGQDTTIDQCAKTGDAAFCGLIQRDQFGSLWRTPDGFIRDTTTNIGAIGTKGIDVGVNYQYTTNSIGSFGLTMQGTWLDKLTTDNGISTPYDCAGYFGLQCGTPNPEWRHKVRLTWNTPLNIGISAQWRYFNKVEIDRASSNETLNGAFAPFNAKIPSQSYFDLAITANVGDKASFRIGAQNLLDRDPPIIGTNGTSAVVNGGTPVLSSGNTFPQVYDALGRYIYVGFTVDF